MMIKNIIIYAFFSTCWVLIGGSLLIGQGNEGASFKVVMQGVSPVQTGSYPLMNERGYIEGYYLLRQINDQQINYYLVNRQGGQSNVPGLTDLYYIPGADRLLMVGDDLHSHIVGKVKYGVYTSSGQTIREPELIGQYPYVAAASGQGDLFIAAQGIEPAVEGKLQVSKISRGGNPGWQISLAMLSPIGLTLSRDGRYLGLIQHKVGLEAGSALWILDARSGRIIEQYNTSENLVALEFLPQQEVALVTSEQWQVYSFKSDFVKKHSGDLMGNPLGARPLSAHPSQPWFTLVTLGDPPYEADFRITAINSQTGALMAEKVFPGKPYWQPYRLAEILPSGNIEFIMEAVMVELELDY